jgi:hypothetical protein
LVQPAEGVDHVATGERGVTPVGVLLRFDGGNEVAIAEVGDGSIVTRVV